jgi:hypothetical protein
MGQLSFIHLNPNWNAEPNAPTIRVEVNGSMLRVWFDLNTYAYEAQKDEVGLLTFDGCSRWRWDETNDHAWYQGQGRFARQAPKWGEFYEVIGDDRAVSRLDWEVVTPDAKAPRHFIFYFRDGAIECLASDWKLERECGDAAMAALRSRTP